MIDVVVFSLLDRRATPMRQFTPRSSSHTVHWCAPHSRTYVTLTVVHALDRDMVWPLINDALARVYERLLHTDDGLVPSNNGAGMWQLTLNNLVLSIANANNH